MAAKRQKPIGKDQEFKKLAIDLARQDLRTAEQWLEQDEVGYALVNVEQAVAKLKAIEK